MCQVLCPFPKAFVLKICTSSVVSVFIHDCNTTGYILILYEVGVATIMYPTQPIRTTPIIPIKNSKLADF